MIVNILKFELMKTQVSFMIKSFNESHIEEIQKRFLNSLDAVFNSVSYIKSIEWTSTKIIEKSDEEECEDNNGEPTCGKRLFTILKKDIFLIFSKLWL